MKYEFGCTSDKIDLFSVLNWMCDGFYWAKWNSKQLSRVLFVCSVYNELNSYSRITNEMRESDDVFV